MHDPVAEADVRAVLGEQSYTLALALRRHVMRAQSTGILLRHEA